MTNILNNKTQCGNFYSLKLHNIAGPIPTFGLFARVSRTLIRDWILTKHEEHWQSKEKGRLRAFK
jgi:hypothetical protein